MSPRGLELEDVNAEILSTRKGACPSPIQGFQLAAGQAVPKVEEYEFGSLGAKKKGTLSITPPGGEGLWLTRNEARDAERRWGYKWDDSWSFWDAAGQGGCPWAGHGVYVSEQQQESVARAEPFSPDGSHPAGKC